MNFDKDLTRKMRVKIWESGISLGMSWKKFAAPHQIRQQMERAGTPQSPRLIELMLGDIFSLISDSHLVALGYRVEPSVSDGPIEIPADTFSLGPEFQSTFERDEVAASGWKYERVKVLKSEDFLSSIDELQRVDCENSHVADGTAEEGALTEKPKRRGGRTSLYPQARAVFVKLFEDKPHLKLRPAAKIASEFNQLYKEMHSPDGGDFSSLHPKTIRTHLARYRKELANTGNN